jgi:hypothetical protein
MVAIIYLEVGRMGNTINRCWNIQKYHHQFYNPTSFAVITEDYIDQIIGALPLILFPAIISINIIRFFFEVKLFISN